MGFSIGGNHSSQNIIIQDLNFSNTQYGFQCTPEIGVFAQFTPFTPAGLKLSVAYTVATNTYSFHDFKATDMQNLNVNLGLVFMINSSVRSQAVQPIILP